MTKIICGLIILNVLLSCSGPSYFNRPSDYVGGNRAAAVETHCARRAGDDKGTVMYKLCEQAFTVHYGK